MVLVIPKHNHGVVSEAALDCGFQKFKNRNIGFEEHLRRVDVKWLST
ncbi:MAG: hypothetical protein M1371_05250 [Actinobacteria bacterium]|nr:hypothetical protein [Actinomycetota bacterium]